MGEAEDRKYLEKLELRKPEFEEVETVVEDSKDIYSLPKEALAEFLVTVLSQDDVVGLTLHVGQDVKVCTRVFTKKESLLSKEALSERNPNIRFVEIVECPKCHKRYVQDWMKEPRLCSCSAQTMFLGGADLDIVVNKEGTPAFDLWLTNLKF